jgi:hypothetical protein
VLLAYTRKGRKGSPVTNTHFFNNGTKLEDYFTEDGFPKDTNIATKMKWKLFIKVIREPSKEAWVWIFRESN